MTRGDLAGPILAAVSRSFYLTIRLLPRVLREPIGLTYLLARATDTIADSPGAPAATRLAHLTRLEGMIAGGNSEGLAELQRDIQPPDDGERRLIGSLGECLEWLQSCDAESQGEIRRVMPKIIRGQRLDLERFETAGTGVVALQTEQELDEYTYLVAGCVGEFWTRLCQRKVHRYSDEDSAHLTTLGIDYGKGLQLVNILRDLPSDLRAGRCYLPERELIAAGTRPDRVLAEPAAARAVVQHWHKRAMALMDQGRMYLRAVRPARIRLGCFLPWDLGVRTLRLMEVTPPLESAARVKVGRSVVRAALLRGLVVAVSNRPLDA